MEGHIAAQILKESNKNVEVESSISKLEKESWRKEDFCHSAVYFGNTVTCNNMKNKICI